MFVLGFFGVEVSIYSSNFDNENWKSQIVYFRSGYKLVNKESDMLLQIMHIVIEHMCQIFKKQKYSYSVKKSNDWINTRFHMHSRNSFLKL